MRFFLSPPPLLLLTQMESESGQRSTLSPCPLVEGLDWGMGTPVDGALSHIPLSLWLFSLPGACLFSSLSLGPLPLSFGVSAERSLPPGSCP